jgi:hypothetical protein
MAFLEFVKDQQASQRRSVAEKFQHQPPATAPEMYAAQDAHDKSNQRPLTPKAMRQADRVEATLHKASFHIQFQAAHPSPTEGGGNREPDALERDATGKHCGTFKHDCRAGEESRRDGIACAIERAGNLPTHNSQSRQQGHGGWDW